MKFNLSCLLISFLLFTACQELSKEQPKQDDPSSSKKEAIIFDAELAKKYGADEYGMRQYVIAFLKKGPNRSQDSLTRINLQNAHMENIGRLAEEGKLIIAGPFLDDTDLRGIYIFDVKTVEEAEALTQTDPAIQAGSLIMELHPWYGSAAMMAVPDIYPKISKIKI